MRDLSPRPLNGGRFKGYYQEAAMTNLRLKLLLLSLKLLMIHSSVRSSSSAESDTLLIFEGTVIKVGDLPSVSCGVMAVYQLAKYRVDHVLVGDYKAPEIVVDHLACNRDVLQGVSAGDKVIVVVNKRSNVPQRWNAEGIRSSNDKVNIFYVAKRVARATSCCDSE